MIRVSFVVPVTLSFAEGLLEFDWMYVVNRQCESREDHRKKQTEWDEEYVWTGVYDLQGKFLREDLKKWGLDYDKG